MPSHFLRVIPRYLGVSAVELCIYAWYVGTPSSLPLSEVALLQIERSNWVLIITPHPPGEFLESVLPIEAIH